MKMFIPGGAGFIGCNCAKHFMDEGHDVILFDNLSRIGSNSNLNWLKSLGEFDFIKGDMRDFSLLQEYFQANPKMDVVIHLAAQTAVTTSILNPREDFEINALGTLNLLEAIRLSDSDPIIIYASTNKVYGSLDHLKMRLTDTRYELVDYPEGIPEDFPLDFHSPYGCSKGVADQYVRDYHRIYGMKTVVFRQSCIYGPRQFGVEDQGWVAWFMISALKGIPVTIYGDGCQVRDVLYVRDLIELFKQAIRKVESLKGNIYNIGGGPQNQISLLELIDLMKTRLGISVKHSFSPMRPGDQKVYFSDISKCGSEICWRPSVFIKEGIENLYKWCSENMDDKEVCLIHTDDRKRD